jgi:hypothetical protein
MRDSLPNIHVTVANPRRFMEKMAHIAKHSGSFTVDHPEDGTVSLRYSKPSSHSHLGALQRERKKHRGC